ncbi:MAG TPA: preprotein translocase subunit SecG [Allosphingosinicella sp.]|nr:preprotein translocase subunit SecG [Allosphingosinicella sp.]
MFTFLLIIQSLVAASMVAVILMQRSEGGGLGVGGSPSGLMSARGAADFLTRATAILATIFVVLSIALAGLASIERAPTRIDPSLSKQAPAGAPLAPAAGAPAADPLAGAAAQAPANAAAGNGAVPLAQ